MLLLLVVICLFSKTSNYWVNQNFLNTMEAGFLIPYTTYYDPPPPQSHYSGNLKYQTQFKTKFDNIPVVLNAMMSYEVIDIRLTYLYTVNTNKKIYLTKFECQMYWYSQNSLMYIKIRYLAMDLKKIQSIKWIYVGYAQQASNNFYKFLWNSGKGLISDSPKIFCFITNIGNFKIHLPISVNYSCKATTNSQIQLTIETTLTLTQGFSWAACQAIAFFPNHYIRLVFDQLLATVSNLNPRITLNTSKSNTHFFIGLSYFKTQNTNINIVLSNDNEYVYSTNDFNEAGFPYFQIFLPPKCNLDLFCFPYENKIKFIYYELDQYTIQIPSIEMGTTLEFDYKDSHTLVANTLTPITNNLINIYFDVVGQVGTHQIDTKLKITTVESMTINAIKNEVDLQLINIDEIVSLNNFIVNDGKFEKKYVDNSNNKLLNLKYQKQVIDIPFTVSYISSDGLNKSTIELTLSSVTTLETSALSTNSHFLIQKIPNIQTFTNSQITWDTLSVIPVSNGFSIINSNIVKANFKYKVKEQESDIFLTYQPFSSSVSSFKTIYKLKLITVKSVETIVNTSFAYIIFTNVYNSEVTTLSEFTTSLPQLVLLSLETIGNKIKLKVNYENYMNSIFSALYSSNTFPYNVRTTDLKFNYRFIKFEYDIFEHWINFTMNNIEGFSFIPDIRLNHVSIQPNTSTFDGDKIIYSTQFTSSLDGQWLSIIYDSDPTTIYQDITTLQLVDSSPIAYCIKIQEIHERGFMIVSYCILVSYWGMFVISLFLCQKIHAIEIMFVLQFAYMSLIPIGVYCPPFRSMNILKYSFGWNQIPFGFEQSYINMNYSVLGFKSNILSNVNFMLFIMLLCPLVYYFMNSLGNKSSHFRAKPRLLIYGKTFLCDIPFTLLILSIPNICVSTVISMQTLGTNNVLSFISCLLLSIMVIVGIILFLIYQKQFKQFNEEFSSRKAIFKFSIKFSTSLKKLYSLIIMMEIITVSTILAIESLFEISLYISLGILFTISILLVIISPYDDKLSNVRLLINRIFMVIVCLLLVGFKVLRIEGVPKQNIVYRYPWIILLLLLVGSLSLHIPFMTTKAFIWIKSKNLIDIQLYNKQKKKIGKTSYPNDPPTSGSFYPALEYSMHPTMRQQSKIYKQSSQTLKTQKKTKSLPIVQPFINHDDETN